MHILSIVVLGYHTYVWFLICVVHYLEFCLLDLNSLYMFIILGFKCTPSLPNVFFQVVFTF